jgi:cytochrome c553
MSVLVPSASAEDSKVIKDGMKTFHKGDTALIKKVVAGQATDEEIKSLQAYYKSIVAEKPPLGDEASWKDKTAALNKAVDEVAAKDPNGIAHLKEATNCKACHSVHKPK